MNINSQLNEGQKEYGVNSNTPYFKFEKGDNRIRILTEGEVIATHFFGKGQRPSVCYGVEKGCPFHGERAPKDDKGNEKKPSLKYTCYIIDKRDAEEKIQIADLPYSIIKQVGDYQENIDYAFTSFPMPYDVTVKFDPDSPSPASMYKVIASPKQEPVSDTVMGKLAEKMTTLTPKDSVAKKKNRQMQEHTEQGILITPEKAKENRKEWVERVNKEAAAKGELELDTIDYPVNEINPEDIPF